MVPAQEPPADARPGNAVSVSFLSTFFHAPFLGGSSRVAGRSAFPLRFRAFPPGRVPRVAGGRPGPTAPGSGRRGRHGVVPCSPHDAGQATRSSRVTETAFGWSRVVVRFAPGSPG